MTGREADALSRDVIASAGYGDAFTHSLGHGIGLEVHEPPWLSQSRGDEPLRPGMVFSVEPGIYLPGLGRRAHRGPRRPRRRRRARPVPLTQRALAVEAIAGGVL